MKILAIGTLKSMTPHQQRKYMPAEVPATLKLYLRRKDGAVLASRRQRGGYLFDDRRLSQAETLLKAMPLGGANPSDL
jgi:hypothetical protein